MRVGWRRVDEGGAEGTCVLDPATTRLRAQEERLEACAPLGRKLARDVGVNQLVLGGLQLFERVVVSEVPLLDAARLVLARLAEQIADDQLLVTGVGTPGAHTLK
jgi:hypothetical protein